MKNITRARHKNQLMSLTVSEISRVSPLFQMLLLQRCFKIKGYVTTGSLSIFTYFVYFIVHRGAFIYSFQKLLYRVVKQEGSGDIVAVKESYEQLLSELPNEVVTLCQSIQIRRYLSVCLIIL